MGHEVNEIKTSGFLAWKASFQISILPNIAFCTCLYPSGPLHIYTSEVWATAAHEACIATAYAVHTSYTFIYITQPWV